ncbi:MAG TPA: 30S ribosomal protein S20 [Candidatus Omnitrophota bacterium]|nr:30S ribosomal protein S20 [Candidatus Omnitrophota bacterium]
MANRRAAVKSLRVDKKRHARNMRIKNELKKTIKNFQALVAEKKSEEARKVLLKVSSLLDKAAKKNVIHANTASRRKSRLSRKVLKAA